MHWERLSEDVYVFTSDRYAQVTASLIVSGSIGVVIDTLPFPQETSQIAYFARRRCPDGVRYVVYTQHQADHTYGAFLFPRAEVISHTLAREILLERGVRALEQAKAQNRELELVRLRIPTLTFDTGTFTLRLPGKTLELFPTPGHTPDAISVILQEEKILFAGDTIMAIPTIGDGDLEQLRASTEAIAAMPLESIVQGHGEIILRGEIKDNIRRSLNYLEHLSNLVRAVVDSGGTLGEARGITIESCGLQRVLLNGMVTQLHAANVVALYQRLTAQLPARPVRPEGAGQEQPAEPKRAPRKTAEKAGAADGAAATERTTTDMTEPARARAASARPGKAAGGRRTVGKAKAKAKAKAKVKATAGKARTGKAAKKPAAKTGSKAGKPAGGRNPSRKAAVKAKKGTATTRHAS